MAEERHSPLSGELEEGDLERQEETIRTVRRVLHVLLGTLLFCAITVATAPDAHLVRADVQVTMPVIGFDIPFDSFLVIGPSVIIALWAYMHIFYGEFLRFARQHPGQKGKLPTLFNIDSMFARAVSYFFFYWLPIAVLAFFAWKATPRPVLGTGLIVATSLLVAGSLWVQVQRCSGRWCNWAKVPATVTGIGFAAGLVVAADSYRTFDLFETDFAGKDLRDAMIGGANLRGADFSEADLRRARLSGAHAANANFAAANLSGVDLSGADLSHARFHRSNLSDVTLAGANLQHADFTEGAAETDLAGASAAPPTQPGFPVPEFPIEEIKTANNWILAHFTWSQMLGLGLGTEAEASRVDPSDERSRKLRAHDLRGWVLAGHNLVGADLTGYGLGGADLTGSDLTDAVLTGADLQNATLLGARVTPEQVSEARNWVLARYDDPVIVDRLRQRGLTGGSLDGADLSGLDLSEASFAGADARGASFRNSDLTDAQFRGEARRTNVQFADFRGATIPRRALDQMRNWQLAYFSPERFNELGLESGGRGPDHNARLKARDFSGVRFVQPLEPLNLDGADLEGFNFAGATLTGSTFGASSLRATDFSNAVLATATFNDVDLRGAVLTEANLRGARLTGATLGTSDLRRAEMSRAVIEKTDLEGANLEEANLLGAELVDIRLGNANLEKAHFLLTTIACDDLIAANWREARLRGAKVLLDGSESPDGGSDCPAALRDHAVGRIESSGLLMPYFDRVREAVAEQQGLEASSIAELSTWSEDLGMDRFDLVNLVDTLQGEFDCTIPDDAAFLIETPGDAARYLADCTALPAGTQVSKPLINVGTIGDPAHGTAVVASAITKILSETGDTSYVATEKIESAPQEKARGITIRTAWLEYETATRRYSHAHSLGQSDTVKNMLTGAVQMDGAILVIDVPEGPTQATRQQLRLAGLVGVPSLVVYMNATASVSLKDRKSLEAGLRTLLTSNGYRPDEVPVIWGQATTALAGGDDGSARDSIQRLVDALDRTIASPASPVSKPFLMAVEDVFSIAGRGTVVTGRIERGVVETNDRLGIVGLRPTSEARVLGVEMFRKTLERGEAGDNVGLLLEDIERGDVERGQVLAAPGSIAAHHRFRAAIYLLTREEGGRQTPIFSDYRPQFYFRTTDVPGRVRLRSGRDMAAPGEFAMIEVELVATIAMEPGLRFAIRDGGRTVGAGVVTEVAPAPGPDKGDGDDT